MSTEIQLGRATKSGKITCLVFNLIVGLAVVVYGLLLLNGSIPSPLDWIFGALAAILLLIGLLFFVKMIQTLRLWQRIHPPVLLLSSAQPRRGQDLSATLRLASKQPTTLAGASLSLLCHQRRLPQDPAGWDEEQADSATAEIQTIFQQDRPLLEKQDLTPHRWIEERVHFSLPPQLPPSGTKEGNRNDWSLRVLLRFQQGGSFQEDLPLRVQ